MPTVVPTPVTLSSPPAASSGSSPAPAPAGSTPDSGSSGSPATVVPPVSVLTVPAVQTAGAYSGTYTATVTYN